MKETVNPYNNVLKPIYWKNTFWFTKYITIESETSLTQGDQTRLSIRVPNLGIQKEVTTKVYNVSGTLKSNVHYIMDSLMFSIQADLAGKGIHSEKDMETQASSMFAGFTKRSITEYMNDGVGVGRNIYNRSRKLKQSKTAKLPTFQADEGISILYIADKIKPIAPLSMWMEEHISIQYNIYTNIADVIGNNHSIRYCMIIRGRREDKLVRSTIHDCPMHGLVIRWPKVEGDTELGELV